MSVIRLVWGAASGPTAMSSYDAALAEANVHDFNLVTVSSVVPEGAAIEAVGTAPALGPAGDRLTVVQSRATVGPEAAGPAVAGIGWARGAGEDGPGPGIFYEATGTDPASVRTDIQMGLDHGASLREWETAESDHVLREAPAADGAYTTQVVCAVYGESRPIL